MKTIFFKIIIIVIAILLIAPNYTFSNNLSNSNSISANEIFAYAPPCPPGEVEVIFTLDMTCSGTDMRPPVVTGPFNGFSGDGNIMVDPDGDDIWEAIICAVPGSTFEYKYAILNFVEQENLVDDAIGGAPCPYNTNFFDFSNRLVTIPAGGGSLPIDTYGICGTCDNPPVNVTFTINMNCSDVPPNTPVAMFGLFNGFCCPYGLEDPDGDNIWTTTLPFPPDANGCITMEYLYMSPDFSNVESFLTNGEDLANCPNINTDFASFANRIVMVCADTVLDDYWNTCFAPVDPGCDDNVCDNGFETWDGCECITTMPVFGCTDATANNYEPNATCDDGTCTFDLCDDPCAPNFGAAEDCLPYNMTCNDDCSVGPFGGTWDAATCSCINETTPVLGCTDASYCEFNPAANCDDGNCINLNNDPGTCDDGLCVNGIETWDFASCTCISNPPIEIIGCTDANYCEFNPEATCDDGSCITLNADPGICDDSDCTNGFEIWDSVSCTCIDDPTMPPIPGCTDADACNYNPSANCDNSTCDFGNPLCADPCNPVMGCTDPLNCNYDPNACVDDGSCNPDSGCTDDTACNFDIDACVDDGSCNYGNIACPDPCNEPDPDDGCDLTTDTFDASTCTVTNMANCPVGETFNPANCECVIDIVDGCTDPCDPAFDPASTNDDLCVGYNTDCNADCTVGPFGGIWDPATCGCINEIAPVNGCISVAACNYDSAANCDDGSCDFGNSVCPDPCNEPNPDDGCDLTTDTFDAATCTVTNTHSYKYTKLCYG